MEPLNLPDSRKDLTAARKVAIPPFISDEPLLYSPPPSTTGSNRLLFHPLPAGNNIVVAVEVDCRGALTVPTVHYILRVVPPNIVSGGPRRP